MNLKRLPCNAGSSRIWTIWILVLLMALPFLLQTRLQGAGKKKKAEPRPANQKWFLTTGLMLRKAVIVPASAEDVWQAWTTAEGAATFFAPKASIELAVNGDYELYFEPKKKKGEKGSEGCKVLSFVPGEMLSFTWNAPTSMPTVRQARTWVVVQLQPRGQKQTQLSLIHLGWQAGEEWQEALKYFDRAWEVVLARLIYRFRNGPINWKSPYTPPAKEK